LRRPLGPPLALREPSQGVFAMPRDRLHLLLVQESGLLLTEWRRIVVLMPGGLLGHQHERVLYVREGQPICEEAKWLRVCSV
jgi:hypothetical protein